MIGLELDNSFGTWEVYLVGVSLVALTGMIIGTGEVSLVGLSLGIPLGCLLESPNPGSDMPDTLLGAPLGLWFGSEAVRFLFSCHRLVY